MDYLPMFMDLRGRSALVVGGGEVAARKVDLLRAAGAVVIVVAPVFAAELSAREDIVRRPERFRDDHLDAMTIAIAATDEPAVNAAVASLADARNIPVNVVDEPELCRFIFPSIIDRSPVTVAVSTGGLSPVLARLVRSWLEAALPSRLGALAAFAGRQRERVRSAIRDGTERRRFWERVLDGAAGAAILAGDEPRAGHLFDMELNQVSAQRPSLAGRAVLIDVGDGDPETQTLRTLRHLQTADCIIYDAGNGTDIASLARRDATRLAVPPGETATARLQIRLGRGETVVRLACQDRLLPERAALVAAGLSVEYFST